MDILFIKCLGYKSADKSQYIQKILTKASMKIRNIPSYHACYTYINAYIHMYLPI